ncbi:MULTISPECIES: DUF3108 domain-containing protein [Methylotenera]|uniref:DUF3108 domain-containing protein n=1 Tax=Methylotenera TaxID=359407 RepID=UPI000376316E|nr:MULTISPECIES: DUF3108 domain-containing protein [Methylotenera]
MWNNVVDIVKNQSTKRLALAIVVSVVLHAFLVGGLNVHIPSLKKEMHVIEARLQMPKVLIQQEATKEVVVNALPKPIVPLPQEQTPKPVPEAIEEPVSDIKPQKTDVAPEVLSSVALEPVISPVPVEEALQAENSQSVQSEQQAESQPVDAGLVTNENAYQYVETDFDVRTKIDGAAEGSAKITYNLIDNQQYALKSVIKPRGFAALIISDLLQTSDGILTKNGLQPNTYLYRYGDKTDKTYSAKFDWASKMVSLITAKGTKTAEIADGTQDLLSFMYQFMYVAPLERMQISIATGKKLANYDYSFDGEESISIPMGEIKTLHIFHAGDDSDEKTELWLALDYQYVPVKIRKTEKNGKIYELVATRINTARPVVLN